MSHAVEDAPQHLILAVGIEHRRRLTVLALLRRSFISFRAVEALHLQQVVAVGQAAEGLVEVERRIPEFVCLFTSSHRLSACAFCLGVGPAVAVVMVKASIHDQTRHIERQQLLRDALVQLGEISRSQLSDGSRHLFRRSIHVVGYGLSGTHISASGTSIVDELP